MKSLSKPTTFVYLSVKTFAGRRRSFCVRRPCSRNHRSSIQASGSCRCSGGRGGQHHFEAGSVSAWQAGHWQPHSHRLHPGLRSRYLLPKIPTDSAFTDLWFYSNIQTLPHQRRANESKPLEAEANHIVNISFTSQSYPENSLLCGDNRL